MSPGSKSMQEEREVARASMSNEESCRRAQEEGESRAQDPADGRRLRSHALATTCTWDDGSETVVYLSTAPSHVCITKAAIKRAPVDPSTFPAEERADARMEEINAFAEHCEVVPRESLPADTPEVDMHFRVVHKPTGEDPQTATKAKHGVLQPDGTVTPIVIRDRLVGRHDKEGEDTLSQLNYPTNAQVSTATGKKVVGRSAAQNHHRGHRLGKSDFRKAFVLTGSTRTVAYRPPPEAGLPEGMVWVPKCNVYGDIAAPVAYEWELWQDLTALGFEQGKADPCVWTLHDEDGTYDGAIALDVDDLLIAANERMYAIILKELGDKYFIGEMEMDSVTHCAIEWEQSASGHVTAKQTEYVSQMSETPMPLDPTTGLEVTDARTRLGAGTQQAHHSLVMQLRWVTANTRADHDADVDSLQSTIHIATVADLQRANKLLRAMRETPHIHVRYSSKPFSRPVPYCVFDAAYRNRHDGYSTGGLMVGVRETDESEDCNRSDLLYWNAKKIGSSTVHGPTDAETVESAHALEWAMWIRVLLEPLSDRGTAQNRTLLMTRDEELVREVESAIENTVVDKYAEYGARPNVPISQPGKHGAILEYEMDCTVPPADMMSDSENLVSTVYSLRVHAKNKAMGAYISSMRDALVRKQVGALIWIDGNDNPADALTRPSRKANSRPKQLVRAAMAGRMWLPPYETRGTFVRRKQRRPVKKKREARRDLQAEHDNGKKGRMEKLLVSEAEFSHRD